MSKLKIGLLSPISGIYPKMGRDYKNGIQLGLDSFSQLNEKYEFDFAIDFMQKTDPDSVSTNIFKLINHDDVDIITGIINMNTITSIIEEIQSKKIPFIFNNLGEFIPKPNTRAANLFGNSLNLWQSEWTMGKWAQNKYGGNPTVYLSMFDAGYQLYSAFRMGALNAGAKEVNFKLMPLIPNKVDTSELIHQIKTDKPSHAHIVLCGIDAKDFLKRLHSSDLTKEIPITVSPFMVEDEIMEDISEFTMELPNAITWSRKMKNSTNLLFVSSFEEEYKQKPNVFNLLGYETGLLIAGSLTQMENQKANHNRFIDALSNTKIEGPRGKHAFGFHQQDFDILIRRPEKIDKNTFENSVFDKKKSIHPSCKEISTAAEKNISGWYNPYLCI